MSLKKRAADLERRTLNHVDSSNTMMETGLKRIFVLNGSSTLERKTKLNLSKFPTHEEFSVRGQYLMQRIVVPFPSSDRFRLNDDLSSASMLPR